MLDALVEFLEVENETWSVGDLSESSKERISALWQVEVELRTERKRGAPSRLADDLLLKVGDVAAHDGQNGDGISGQRENGRSGLWIDAQGGNVDMRIRLSLAGTKRQKLRIRMTRYRQRGWRTHHSLCSLVCMEGDRNQCMQGVRPLQDRHLRERRQVGRSSASGGCELNERKRTLASSYEITSRESPSSLELSVRSAPSPVMSPWIVCEQTCESRRVR